MSSGLECKPKNTDALILNIGTELTLGATVNTNGSWLARRLTHLGFSVRRIVVLRDDEKDVIEVISEGIKRYGVIVTTGGLGPTYDDNTSVFISKAIGVDVELNPSALEMVSIAHAKRGEELNEARIKQAYMPRGAMPLENSTGTAPGFIMCINGGTILISLPGPPRELQPMFDEKVYPLLANITNLNYIEDFITVIGVTESTIADIVERAARRNPSIYVKTHPMTDESGLSLIKVQLSIFTDDLERGRKAIESIRSYLEKEFEGRLGKESIR